MSDCHVRCCLTTTEVKTTRGLHRGLQQCECVMVKKLHLGFQIKRKKNKMTFKTFLFFLVKPPQP